MKKIHSFSLLLLFVACSPKKQPVAISEDASPKTYQVDSAYIDSIAKSQQNLHPKEQLDRSFDDFLYRFCKDSVYQQNRIVFPLQMVLESNKSLLNSPDWQYHPLVGSEEYFTLLFDTPSQVDSLKEITGNVAVFESIELQTQKREQYFFGKTRDIWLLESIRVLTPQRIQKEGFIAFFQQFATDTVFQSKHIQDPLTYITFDSEDEFEVVELGIGIDSWHELKPALPKQKLTNIYAKQRETAETDHKVMVLKGIGHGLWNLLHFQRIKGTWFLVSFEDLNT